MPAEPAWKSALKRLSEQGISSVPSCAGIALPEHLSALLSKEQICAFLGVSAQTSEPKPALVAHLYTLLEGDAEAKSRFFEIFVEDLAMGPWELEKLLGCTSTERKRWVNDRKLPPIATRTVRKAGKDLVYPVFDRRCIAHITPEILADFRGEHASLVAVRRKAGAKRALARRSQNTQDRQRAFGEIEEMFSKWAQLDFPELAAVFRLAYWTQLASRWAKENKAKSVQATKHRAVYLQHMDEWYRRKDEALQVLVHSSYTRLSYYQPEQADKILLNLCDKHYELLREGYYDGKWDFYACYTQEINTCPACQVTVLSEYYSLYAVEISALACPENRFSFHVPYPIGKSFLPPPQALQSGFQEASS